MNIILTGSYFPRTPHTSSNCASIFLGVQQIMLAMKRQMTIPEVRARLAKLPSLLKGELEPVKITGRGKSAMALMSWELYESFMETMEVMSDKRVMKSLLHSIKEGRTYCTKEVEKRLNL